MNKYKDNFEFYKSTFDEVHASDKLLRKVKNMTETKTKKKIYAVRKVLYIAAAIVAMIVASNAVAYAATGETWVKTVMLNVFIDGQPQEIEAVKTTDADGNVSYDIELDDSDGSSYGYYISGDVNLEDANISIGLDDNEDMPVLTEEDGKVYLEIPDMDIKEDITEDFADGEASVTAYDADGNKIVINIEGNADEYTISYSEE